MTATRADITPADLDPISQVWLLAWSPKRKRTLRRLVATQLGSMDAARAALKTWARLPFSLDHDLPTAPPAGFPAPEEPPHHHLIPGVVLPPPLQVQLAADLLFGEACGKPPALAARARTLGIPILTLNILRERWLAAGHPLRLLRQHHGRPPTGGRLTAREQDQLVKAWTARPDGRRVAWELLTLAGADPTDTWSALEDWDPASGVLPTGQWLPRPAAPRSARVMLPQGVHVSQELADEVKALARDGRTIAAIKALRKEVHLSLVECKRGVEAIAKGTASAAPELSAPHRPTRPSAARRALDAAIDRLLLVRPFYWVLFCATRLVETSKVRTMAVGRDETGKVVLFFSPTFVRAITPDERLGVLVHELNHVIFGHLHPPVRPHQPLHRHAWRIACEVTANEFVGFPLPGQPILLEHVGLPPGQGTIERYDILRGRPDLPPVPPDDTILWLVKKDARTPDDSTLDSPPTAQALLHSVAELVGDELAGPTLAGIRLHGTVAGGSVLDILEPEGLSHLQWHVLLRQLARGLPQRLRTTRWPNRRFPGQVGIVPGTRTRRRKPVVLAAIDTSSSMGQGELQMVSRELVALLRHQVRVACVHCDTQIAHERWLSPGDVLQKAHGRGGTDLRPPFSPPVLRRYAPALVVYFTDGYGPAPEAPPPGVDVLWVLSGTRPRVPARWGKVVCLLPRARRQRFTPPDAP